MARWLVLDYGQVLSTSPPDEEWRRLAAAARADDLDRFERDYWQHRPAYDRGDLSAAEYWSKVASGGDLEGLRSWDVAMWLHPHHPTLRAAERAAGRGWSLALLSNAPVEVADAIDGLDWMQAISPRLFSCRIGEVKPQLQPYRHVLAALEADPSAVVFLDDRPANVAAAATLGMRAEVYAGPDQIDAL